VRWKKRGYGKDGKAETRQLSNGMKCDTYEEKGEGGERGSRKAVTQPVHLSLLNLFPLPPFPFFLITLGRPVPVLAQRTSARVPPRDADLVPQPAALRIALTGKLCQSRGRWRTDYFVYAPRGHRGRNAPAKGRRWTTSLRTLAAGRAGSRDIPIGGNTPEVKARSQGGKQSGVCPTTGRPDCCLFLPPPDHRGLKSEASRRS
jgi:hypothetical protein